MGLFDFMSNQQGQSGFSPGTQGLLALSQALLEAGKPSRIPVSGAQAFGGAINTALPAYQSAVARKNIGTALQNNDLNGAMQSMLQSPDPNMQNAALQGKMSMLQPDNQIKMMVFKQLQDAQNGKANQSTPQGAPAQGQTQQNYPMALAQQGVLTGDPKMDLMYFATSPKDYLHDLAVKNAPTDLGKNVSNPATSPLIQAEYGAKGLVDTAGGKAPYQAVYGQFGATPPGGAAQPNTNNSAIQALTGRNIDGSPADAAIMGNAQPQVALPNVGQMNDPAYQEQRKGLIAGDQKYLNETLLPAKDSAVATIGNIETIQQAAAIANKSDIARSGPTAPARIELTKKLNDFLSATGGTPISQNEIASADAINKVGIRLTANMTKMLGSREAAQIFTKIQEANPSWYMQPQTLSLVSNLIKQDAQASVDRYKSAFSEAMKPGGMAQNGVLGFDKKNPMSGYVGQAFRDSGMGGYESPNDPNFKLQKKGAKFYDLNPQSPTYGQQLIKQ